MVTEEQTASNNENQTPTAIGMGDKTENGIAMQRSLDSFWSMDIAEVASLLRTSPRGLTSDEVSRRLSLYGPNLLKPHRRVDTLTMLFSQFKSPIILILFFAAVLAFFLGDQTNALIIFAIVIISGLLSFWQERGAANAVERLLATVRIHTKILRNGVASEIPVEYIVPGDIVILAAGDLIPGDSLIVESNDLFVDEATLTGETYPAEKQVGKVAANAPLSQRLNALFMGAHVVSGSATAMIVKTGAATEFGAVSERLKLRSPETEFERGIRQFGYLLLEVTLLMVIAIFAFNVYLDRPVLDSFLFALALAVGLTPQLLPAIIGINLAHGARIMAQKQVIVKRLASIENFGSMNILCSDKTGTLTEGTVRLRSALDLTGKENENVLFYAYINAYYETGFANPIDQALRSARQFDLSGYNKIGEIPYDFIRKRLTVAVEHENARLLVTKGALSNVLSVCSMAELEDGHVVDITSESERIQQEYAAFSSQGFRTLGVAYKNLDPNGVLGKDAENAMTFLGFLTFYDPPKAGIQETIARLRGLGISLKMITGDNGLVAANVANQVGLDGGKILTGPELRSMSDEALLHHVNDLDVFAEVEPNQKERILIAYRKAGNVVGYLGDGINDGSALHAADVGISVDTAVDVAKDAADIVLLEKNLGVLVDGVQAGRVTFANTLKYVFMATSANFGNMFSMAGASLFLPFLPLLPSQILLTNLLTDFPEMAIASDSVDRELVEKPRRWDVAFIRRFMIVFGLLSSVFDYITFFVLLMMLNADPQQFRSGWFTESVVSASLVVLVVRTRRLFFRSRPGQLLFLATMIVILIAVLLPFTPLGTLFGFQALPLEFLPILAGIVILYVGGAELAKRLFYRWTAVA